MAAIQTTVSVYGQHSCSAYYSLAMKTFNPEPKLVPICQPFGIPGLVSPKHVEHLCLEIINHRASTSGLPNPRDTIVPKTRADKFDNYFMDDTGIGDTSHYPAVCIVNHGAHRYCIGLDGSLFNYYSMDCYIAISSYVSCF